MSQACITESGMQVWPGTYALLRYDQVPPSRPHHPLPGSHYHYVQANMRPDGKCFWNVAEVTVAPIPGALPRPERFR